MNAEVSFKRLLNVTFLKELARNPILTEYVVRDLNVDPKLPYESDSFDVITNAVSVDYLARPIEVSLSNFKGSRRFRSFKKCIAC